MVSDAMEHFVKSCRFGKYLALNAVQQIVRRFGISISSPVVVVGGGIVGASIAHYLTFVFAPTRGSDARYPIEMGRWGLHIKYQHVNSYPKDSTETYKTGEIGSER